MKNVTVINHPFVTDSLGHLRDINTRMENFRYHSDKICEFIIGEAIRGLEFKRYEIETPLTKTSAQKFTDDFVIIPVLRSGIAMLFSVIRFLPKAKIGFVGLVRDEKTAVAREYYWKLPIISKNSVVLVTDPMLATGGSAYHLLKKIETYKPKVIRLVCVIAAPEGIRKIHDEFPQVQIVTGVIDKGLNDEKFILPGLGDYGDRYFGTIEAS